MIDSLEIHLPFHDEHVILGPCEKFPVLDLRHLIGTELHLSGRSLTMANGVITASELHHPYESLPSSYGSMAVKTFPCVPKSHPYVAIKCSPAKLLTGHNVYGTDDYKICLTEMLGLLKISCPKLFALLNIKCSEISSIDITYSVRADTQQIADEFIKYCSSLRSGHVRSSEQFPTTVYLGKRDSRHKRLKIYLKNYELKNYISNLKKRNLSGELDESISINENLLDFSLGLIRFESTLKKRWFRERGIPTGIIDFGKYVKNYNETNKISFFNQIHTDSFRDIFKTFDGAHIMDYSDENIYQILKSKLVTYSKNGKPNFSVARRVFRFYRSIASEGYTEILSTTPSSTFYRNIKYLRDSGIPIATLQNLHKIKSNLVPIIRLINLDYTNQFPANYVEPKSQLTKLPLRLVG
ncbi:phage/plasmid replication protein, II/X family [Thalassolituus oleivorans]|uniref:phage/plasmid replication protein, II/X family n=1 Tax=Thalassolituus oleivorans TaxID=187493 RepID=UPI0023F33703|nr:phage/plasmid replication protein, II/X family [Thalassolituus oleivorans]